MPGCITISSINAVSYHYLTESSKIGTAADLPAGGYKRLKMLYRQVAIINMIIVSSDVVGGGAQRLISNMEGALA